MVSTDDLLASILKFNDDEYFALNDALFSQRESDLLDIDFAGIALNGPNRIVCSERDNIPIIAAISSSGERDYTIDIKKNSFLVATDLLNGNVFIERAFTSEKDDYYSKVKKDKVGPAPSGLAEQAAQLTIIKVNEKIPVTWNTGKWAFTLIYYDWVSNSITIHLIGDDPISPVFAPAVDPDPDLDYIKSFPAYVPVELSPPLPKPGLSFLLDTRIKDGRQLLKLYASFSFKIRAFNILESPLVYEFRNKQRVNVTVVAPLSLLLLTKNNRLPRIINLVVPVYDSPSPAKESENIQGYCALEVLSFAGIKALAPEEYICYIIMSGNVYGPQLINLRG
jgi:hypothetical protein